MTKSASSPTLANHGPAISIIIPALNEAEPLSRLLAILSGLLPDAEVIVVDDGSTDATSDVVKAAGATLISHPYSLGNGAAIKHGARVANGRVLVTMDADGQHDPADIPRLLSRLEDGYSMVVGARTRRSQATLGRAMANAIYNLAASHMTGHKVLDLTSGFRAVRAIEFRRFLSLLPNKFSYPTTITMAFFRSGYPVAYVPIEAASRKGPHTSHIRPLKDGIRFLIILFKVATLYSPLKIFVPISTAFFLLGAGYYAFTYFAFTRFTNMSALLLSAGIITFLMGLLSEQITALSYRESDVKEECSSAD